MNDNLATVRVLWQRDLTRFFREKSRVVGALLQPLLMWVVIGGGFSPTFKLASAAGLSYKEFFFPGVILMVVLFTSIFATMSLIDDRHAGFLQAVLIGPGSRASLVLGKCLGSTSVALVQSGLFVLLAPLAGIPFSQIAWPMLLLTLFTTAFALTALGFAVAWWLDSTQGYHVVMSLVLIPSWILSGAMFPLPQSLAAFFTWNPMSHAASAIRYALYAGHPPSGTVLSPNPAFEFFVIALFALITFSLSVMLCRKKA